MKARLLIGLFALLAFPGCFDPIVGTQCAKGYTRCGSKCVVVGTCTAADAGADVQNNGVDGLVALDTVSAEALTPDVLADGEDAAINDSDTGLAIDGPAAADASSDSRSPGMDDTGPAPTEDAGLPDTSSGEGGSGEFDAADDAPVIPPDATPDAMLTYDRPAPADASSPDAPCPDCDSGVDAPSVETGGLAEDAADAHQEDGSDSGDAEGDVLGEEVTPLVCEGELSICDNQCFDLKTDPNHCGTCTTVCETGICNEGTCFTCPAEVPKWCNGSCINPDLDADNCGACGNYCGTGICSQGQCEAAGTGRVVVIGHDYTAPRWFKNYLLGNAVFLWPRTTVRVLVYQDYATQVAMDGANSAIAQVAGSRPYVLMPGSASTVATTLASGGADVFLIYAQTNASDAALDQLGLDWGQALYTFVKSGGILIILDADQAGNSGTVRILSSACQNYPDACLLQVTRQASVPGTTWCNLVAAGDALASSVTKRYACQNYTTTFTLGESGTKVTSVVEAAVGDAGSAPVVLSKVFF